MSEKQLSEDEITSLPKSLIQVGVPLEFPIYDIHGRLLMQAGMVITSEDQLERLHERGLYLNKKTINQLRAGKTKGGAENKKDKDKDEEPSQKLVDLPLKLITLGESLQIAPLADETKSTKYIVKFLGGLEKGSLVCTSPTVDEKLIYIKEHSAFRVQLFSGKEVYSFTTTVEAVYNRPYPHMHLKFPRGVYVKNLRNNQRVETNIISSLINKTEGDFKEVKSAGRILDISLGGAMIESNTNVGNIGDEIECTFKLVLNKTEVFFSIPSTLRSVTESSETNSIKKYKQGIQFKEIAFQEKAMLQNYIYQRITGKDLSSL
jgi:c-di-GMP-binding flagellar brake protein YcgR